MFKSIFISISPPPPPLPLPPYLYFYIRLKSASLSVVKIADFGLSAFYRPGTTMKSSCGTLSFLAPEVFNGTANAGPPLDVWSLGVILFALLCGRLPFEGPDLNGTKRPRDTIIKSRIIKGLYKIDENLGPEAKVIMPFVVIFSLQSSII